MNFKRRGAETGSGFQEAINRTNEAYLKLGRACITRKAIPGKYILEPVEARRGLSVPEADWAPERLTTAALHQIVKEEKLKDWRRFVPESKAEPDYGGALAPEGRAICYDAKTTRRDQLDFDNLHAHQITFLSHMANCGAVAGFLVEFSRHREVYFLPIQVLNHWRAASSRKSLPYHFFAEHLTPAPPGKGLIIFDYLSAIEAQERRYGRNYARFQLLAARKRKHA